MINKFKNKIYQFLKWTEKWTKTDMIYLVHGSFWLSMIQFFSIISGFLTSLAFANLLPIETYGQYKYILSIITILSIPTLNQMNVAIIQSVANGHEGTLGLAIKTKIKYGLLGGVASIILAGYYYLNNNNNFTILFLILAPLIPLFNSFSIYGAFLNGKRNYKLSTKYNIITNLLSTILLITTLFFTNNLITILLAFFIPRNIINYIFYKLIIKKTKNAKIDKDAIEYGKFLSLMGIIGTIGGNIDKMLLWHYIGPTQLAIYSFANAPILQIKSVLKFIPGLALPKLSKKNDAEIKKTLPTKILKYFFILIIPTIIIIVIIPFFFNIFYKQYNESIFFSQLLAPTILLTPIPLLNTFLIGKKKKGKLIFTNTIFSSTKIILFILLIPKFGILGLIITLYLMGFINYTYFYIIMRKQN